MTIYMKYVRKAKTEKNHDIYIYKYMCRYWEIPISPETDEKTKDKTG